MQALGKFQSWKWVGPGGSVQQCYLLNSGNFHLSLLWFYQIHLWYGKKKDDNLIEVITVSTWSLSPNATLVCCCKFTGKLGEAWEERPQMSRTDCGLLLPCFQALWLKRNPSTILNAHSVLSARPDDHETSSAGAMLVCAQQNLRV